MLCRIAKKAPHVLFVHFVAFYINPACLDAKYCKYPLFYKFFSVELIMAKVKGLGRGLDALLSVAKVNLDDKAQTREYREIEQLVELPLHKIQAGKYQPRQIFNQEELEELAASIRHNGLIQPVIVRLVAKDQYELIAGERRARASKLAGLKAIPAIIRDFSDEEALAVSLIENIQRKDLNIVEEAQGYKRLIDEFGLTHEALASVTGKSRSNISNTLRLLNLMPEVLAMLMGQRLDMGHARALLPLTPDLQLIIAEETILKKYTTAEVENKVARILHEQKFGSAAIRNKPGKDPDITSLEATLADKLGMMVVINHRRDGNGKISINYSSIDELENFLGLLR